MEKDCGTNGRDTFVGLRWPCNCAILNCMKDSIIGHSDIIQFFETVIAHDSLSHAYCFVGRGHSGKLTVTEELVARLLNTPKEHLYRAPDLAKVVRARDEKTEKLKKDISVEQIRDTIQFFSETPFIRNGYKILIIDEAELMSKAASNALLKTLEEPRGKRIIFLLTENEHALLPTIQSRCQKIYFRSVPSSILLEYAIWQGASEVTAQEMVHYAHGLPGVLVSWLADKEQFAMYKAELDRFRSLRGKAFYEKLQAIEDLFGDKTDHIAARDRLTDILDIWHTNINQWYDYSSPKQIVELHDWFLKTKALLRQNIHPRLLVEHIMLQLV